MKKSLITFFTVLFCLTSSISWSLEYKDLVKRDGLYYKKFTEVPFTGKISGKSQFTKIFAKGSFKNGKKFGSWVFYYDNGQLSGKGNFKNGKRDGYWVDYFKTGRKSSSLTGTYKDGKKISD